MRPLVHIGKSLLPSALEFFDLMGIREKVESYGFQHKPGAHIEWGSQQWDLFFGELSGDKTYSFQVIRSEFDQLLLEHAKSQGVQVFEGVAVREVLFEEGRARSATLARVTTDVDAEAWNVPFDFVIDASGRSSLLVSRYLKNRRYHEAFRNVALWGYWQNAQKLRGDKEGAIATVAITHGWIWAIPLHDGTTSVGVIMHKDTLKEKHAVQTLEEIYREAIYESSSIAELVSPGELVTPVSTETDYSYTAERFAGPGFFLVGDAACFLDPLLSTGVHLAMLGSLLAAASINSIVHGEVGEQEAMQFFEKCYRSAYLRLLVFVSSFYSQNSGKESIFWTAHNLSHRDTPAPDLRQAFTSLASGIEDLKNLKDHGDTVQRLVRDEMTKRLQENLELRQDKEVLLRPTTKNAQKLTENARFFDLVEGLRMLSPESAIEGLYVSTKPRLGLRRGRILLPVVGYGVTDSRLCRQSAQRQEASIWNV